MKIDRLLEIVIYLLNHDCVTARQLAERFGVSVRTIQRDMDSISLAGIPLTATTGNTGGYSIAPSYRVRNHFVKREDFSIILMALQSLQTGYENSRLEGILEKYLSLSDARFPRVFLDYSVTKEDRRVLELNKLLEQAIEGFQEVTFAYRDVQGKATQRIVQPLAMSFKWYAWYLLAYDTIKEGLRTFKVSRVQDLTITENYFAPVENVELLLRQQEEAYYRSCVNIKVWCHHNSAFLLHENFPDAEIEVLPDGHCRMLLRVPPAEPLWKALLLGLGGDVKVLEPDAYREELAGMARAFVAINDTQVS